MVPAHWLKIEPIPMGDKKEKIYVMVLVRLTSKSNYLGLTSEDPKFFTKKAEFEFPGFSVNNDVINTHLMQQL